MAESTVAKSKIFKEDMNLASGGTGAIETGVRRTSTGGEVTLTKLDASHLMYRTYAGSVENSATGDYVAYDRTTIDAQITAIGSNSATLRILPLAVAIATDLTIPANIKLKIERGGVLTIATTKTLTINGPFDAGLYQVFSRAGTGKVVFGDGSVTAVYPVWFGADPSGGLDSAAAMQLAINSVKDNAKVPVKLGAGTFLFDSTVSQYRGVGIFGENADSTTITLTGNFPAFDGAEDLSISGLARYTLLSDMTIDASTNTNDIALIKYENIKLSYNDFVNLRLIGNPAAEQIGIHCKMDVATVEPIGKVYNCLFYGIRGYNLNSLYGNIYLETHRGYNSANVNTFENCAFGPDNGYRCGIRITAGAVNAIKGTTFDAVTTPIRSSTNTGTDAPVVLGMVDTTGVESVTNNSIIDSWFETAFSDTIQVVDYGSTFASLTSGLSFAYNSVALSTDRIYEGVSNYAFNVATDTLTQTATTTCTVAGDYTTNLKDTYKVYANCGADGWRMTTLDGDATYGAGVTTITVADAVLTANLAELILARDYSVATGKMKRDTVFDRIYGYIHTLTARNATIFSAVFGGGTAITNVSTASCTLLNTGVTETVVTNTTVTATSKIFLFPTSANAAAAVGAAAGVYISAKSAGVSFTITHPASPGADATMSYLVIN